MVHCAPDLDLVAFGIREANELVVSIASRLHWTTAGSRFQSRGCLCVLDCRSAASISTLQVVRGSEAAQKRLVALVFVILCNPKYRSNRTCSLLVCRTCVAERICR